MQTYRNPRRHQSDLFNRMQNQVRRITKKLSAVKEQFSQKISHSSKKPLAPQKDNYLWNESTTRLNQSRVSRTNQKHPQTDLDNKTTPVRVKVPVYIGKTVRERHHQHLNSQVSGSLVRKLQEENRVLQEQVAGAERMCSERCYKLGYMQAFYRDRRKEMEHQNEQLAKENIHYGHLLQQYKHKAKSYKRRLGRSSSISSTLSDNQ